MWRFNESLERVIKLEDSAAIMAFKARLKRTCFALKLFNKKPKNLADFRKLAYEEMEVEDMLEEKSWTLKF